MLGDDTGRGRAKTFKAAEPDMMFTVDVDPKRDTGKFKSTAGASELAEVRNNQKNFLADVIRDRAEAPSEKMSFGPVEGDPGANPNTIDVNSNYRVGGNLPAPPTDHMAGRKTVKQAGDFDE